MNQFPWGKLLFEITLSALKDGMSRRNSHYRLRGMLVAFQAWIYETFPSLDGVVVIRISMMHPHIKNWITDEQPSAAKLEGPDCFSNPNYKKTVQPKFSPDSRSDKSRIERSVVRVGTSGKSGPLVLLLTDSSVRQASVLDNDEDDFVDPLPIWQETSPLGKSPTQDCPSAAHHSPMKQQAREAQWG
ncbi:Hypothetical predicted protein [Olea europaea subsp. europaea]|uniref:Uncharacterized protein n=1 Tax=Olea europaea subsp. europaea TaxID=158383 RepID=A0A8S0QV59_OLEEU|nr:Hypothetical predicted protein [Olea europaea subsp. europaea]